MNYERLVELKRWKGVGFGFSVIGGSDTHIPPMICALVRDSPALLSKQVFVGDVLYKVNGISVANLETKEVVDLIRNCEEFIVLSLKEDRLAKLKARPFLAEDTLIEPPRSAGNIFSDATNQNNSTSYRPTVGSPPREIQYGTEGKFTRRTTPKYQKQSPTTNSLDRTKFNKDDSSSGVKSRLDGYRNNVVPPHQQQQQQASNSSISYQQYNSNSPKVYDNHINRLLKLPHTHSNSSNNSSNSINSHSSMPQTIIPDTKKYPSEVFTPSHMSNSISDSRVPFHNNVLTISKCQSSRPSSGQKMINSTHSTPMMNHKKSNMYDYNDGNCMSYLSQSVTDFDKSSRRFSNPSENFSNQSSLTESDSSIVPYEIACDTTYNVSNYTTLNNHSSPNIYPNNDLIYSEHKNISLNPVTQSQHSINKNHYNEQIIKNIDSRHLSPCSNQTINTSQEHSPCSSSLSSSHLESPGVLSTTASVCSDEVSPADIASRLFTLNGYKDCDVAPLLGKNSPFSQQCCREYLRFFTFEGLSLDDSLRQFLKKFPLTGETQERERILIHFSKRFYECNKTPDMSEDALHTLTCALMLLNTDLHRHGITNKMSLNDFINNLSGLCDGNDFSKEYLKTLYNAIKSKEITFASNPKVDINTPKITRKNSAPGNPFVENLIQIVVADRVKSNLKAYAFSGVSRFITYFIEMAKLKTDDNDMVLCEGLIYKKSVMDPGGRRTPAMRRNWRPCYCVLKGLVLYSYKPDNTNSHEPQTLGIHHSLAGYAKDYKKRAFVFKLITADWSVLYIQVKSQNEVKKWMDSINVSAALLSSPPLPAPCGSAMTFQRPVMPVSKTKLTSEEQLSHHLEKVRTIETDLSDHREYTPDSQSKHYNDWENKLDYLEFEVKRFKAYLSVLTAIRLEPIREKIKSSFNAKNCPNLSEQSRSTSMHSLVGPTPQMNNHVTKQEIKEDRKNYCADGLSP